MGKEELQRGEGECYCHTEFGPEQEIPRKLSFVVPSPPSTAVVSSQTPESLWAVGCGDCIFFFSSCATVVTRQKSVWLKIRLLFTAGDDQESELYK